MAEVKEKKRADYSNSAESLINPPEIGEKLKELYQAQQDVKLQEELLREIATYQHLKTSEQKVADLTAQIKDMIDAQGSYQDLEQGYYAVKYRRVSKAYEAEPFIKAYPQFVPAVIINSVNTQALQGLIKGGLITEEDLKRNLVQKESINYAYVVKVE